MRWCFCIIVAVCFSRVGAAQTAPNNPPANMLISSGVGIDYFNHQPSANFSFAPHVTDLAGMPTYSVSTFETAFIKNSASSAQSLTLRTGVLQIPWHGTHYGLFVLTDAGVLKFDMGTLATFTGGGGLYLDVGGLVTKDKQHVWISPMVREVSLAGQQVKPVYGFQVSTIIKKD
jgi:hypothetical protein